MVPLVAGGSHEPSNVALAHFLCNSYKADELPDPVLGSWIAPEVCSQRVLAAWFDYATP